MCVWCSNQHAVFRTLRVATLSMCVCLHDLLTSVSGETSLAESCCHSCLAWTRRGSKSLERLSNPPTSSASPPFKFSPHQPTAATPRNSTLPRVRDRGLGGRRGGWFGCKNVGRKGKIEGWGGVSKDMKKQQIGFNAGKDMTKEKMYSWQEGMAEFCSSTATSKFQHSDICIFLIRC